MGYCFQFTLHPRYRIRSNEDERGFNLGIKPPLSKEAEGVLLYPNPAQDKINIVIPESLSHFDKLSKTTLSIYNAQGQQLNPPLFRGNNNNPLKPPLLRGAGGVSSPLSRGVSEGRGVYQIDISTFPKGVYFVVLQGEKQIWRSKFIVE